MKKVTSVGYGPSSTPPGPQQLIQHSDKKQDLYTGTERFFIHVLFYIGAMPQLVQIETWFFGIIHCIFLQQLYG